MTMLDTPIVNVIVLHPIYLAWGLVIDIHSKVLMEKYPAGPRKNAGNVC